MREKETSVQALKETLKAMEKAARKRELKELSKVVRAECQVLFRRKHRRNGMTAEMVERERQLLKEYGA